MYFFFLCVTCAVWYLEALTSRCESHSNKTRSAFGITHSTHEKIIIPSLGERIEATITNPLSREGDVRSDSWVGVDAPGLLQKNETKVFFYSNGYTRRYNGIYSVNKGIDCYEKVGRQETWFSCIIETVLREISVKSVWRVQRRPSTIFANECSRGHL